MAEREAEPIDEVQQLQQLLEANQPQLALALVHQTQSNADWVNDSQSIIRVTFNYLTTENFEQRPRLYKACEDILEIIAHASKDEYGVLYELLEICDDITDDDVAVSVMKGMQACLLRPWPHGLVQPLEWCFNALHEYVLKLPLSQQLFAYLDKQEERLLEQNEEVRRVLGFYFYLHIFYEPISQRIIVDRQQEGLATTAIDYGVTETNVMLCFIINLLQKPLAMLDLATHRDNGKPNLTNASTRECVGQLIDQLVKLMPNPYNLIEYVEMQQMWPLPELKKTDVDAPPVPITNIFRLPKKAPPLGLSVMFYLLIAEDYMPPTAPQIYDPVYVFERCLYMVKELLCANEGPLHYKALRLCSRLLKKLNINMLESDTLELDIHNTFLDSLVHMLTITRIYRNSQEGVILLRAYIRKFRTAEAQHYHMRRLLQTVSNGQICGFVAFLYKDLVVDEITTCECDATHTMSPVCTGPAFRSMLLDCICVLPNGVATELGECKDHIMAALNFILFFAMRDRKNLSGFWDHLLDLERSFLQPLRVCLDHSQTRNRMEKTRMQQEKRSPEEQPRVEIALEGMEDYAEMTEENREKALDLGINLFDMMEMAFSRLNEMIDANKPKATK